MAEEYIADVVRKGAKAVQRWREMHPNAPVMLVGLDLSRINLVGADLSRANMTGCSMHLAIMISANLSQAKLTGAKLRGANLVGANLASADMKEATLTGAILQNANLQGADLRGANLRRADLRGCLLRGANLEGADLDGAIVTEAERAQIEGREGGGQDAAQRAAANTFGVQLGSRMTAIDLARLLKALDDIHVFMGLAPVRIEQVAVNLDSSGPDAQASAQVTNWLVVQFDRKAAEWLMECMGPGLTSLRSEQARIIRYKKLGMSEEDVWHNIRPLLQESNDPLGALRDLFQKEVLLSFGTRPDRAQGPESPVAEAAPGTRSVAPTPPAAPESPAQEEIPAVDDHLLGYIKQLENPDWSVRSASAEYLGSLGPAAQAAMPWLMKAAEDENIFVREAAEDAIRKIAGAE